MANQSETLHQQLTRIVKDFDAAKVCPGVVEDRFAIIKHCAGAVFVDGIWRSTGCTTIFSSEKDLCGQCYNVKRALSRALSKPNKTTNEEKLSIRQMAFRLAQQKLNRKENKLNVCCF